MSEQVNGHTPDALAKIIDPDAWHETLPADGCGVYWIGRRNEARAKAEAIINTISAREYNKAGGLWYRRWFKAQNRVNELEAALRPLLGHDNRFQVAVGGNPVAVDEMLANANAAISRTGAS